MSNIAINDAFADFEPKTGTTPAAAPAQVSLDDAFADFEAAPSSAPAREMTAEEKALTPGYYLQHGEPGLGRPSPGLFALADVGEGAILGATSGALEIKDLFAGEPEGGRPWLDARKEEIDTHSPIIGPVSQGIGQFAIGIYGLGGAGVAAKTLPWFGRGLKAAEAALTATSKGKLAAELGRDAAAIYITSDPHTERLGNLLQNTTWGKPLGDFLTSDPDDSAAEGRFKATLEGIGLDLALRGALLGSARVFKALWYGDAEKAAKLTLEAEAETRAAIAGPAPDVSAVPDVSGVPDAAPLADDLAPTPRPDVTSIPEAGGLDTPEPPRSGEAPSATLEADTAPVPAAESPRLPATVYEDTEALLGTVRADEEAIAKFGGYQAAADAGHQFGRGESIPYAKLNNTDDVNAFLARVVDAEEERIVTAKGGAVQHDADIERIALERAKLFGDDPATFIGQMQGAAEAAVQMSANAQAANIIVKRMAFDTIALARKLAAEDYAEFGGKLQAYAEFDRRRDILMALHASAGAIRSNVGRTLRLSGGRLAIDPAILDSIPSLDTERMIAVFAASDGTAGSIAKLTSPSLMAKVVDFGQTLLVNNLISGWTTALVNVLSNSYMVGARPLERILGAAPKAAMGDATSRAMVREATRQYLYTGSAFIDGFRSAAKAFAANDSVLAPRSTELYRINQGAAQAVPGPAWKPWDSTANVLHNVFASIQPAALPGTAMKVIGVPTRVNGFLDEITKQTVYRSKVMARAHGDAVEEATRLGLAGSEARQFVREFVGDKLAKAFDANGMGVDQAARREAEIATFSQDLLPGSVGRDVQKFATSQRWLRFILPFIKTPTNILRYGWKMTPGLNRLQAEHRAMLKGEMGAEMQAQAKGQAALGTLAMLSMASFVSMGTVTGGGPRDWKRKQELLATGWQPYSVVFENDDGTKRYVSYGRLDPIAVPLGIMADLQDAMLALGDDDADGQFLDKLGTAGFALGIALINQFTSKSYLTGLSQFLDAVQEPDTRLEPTLGRMASNFVPFASMLRQTDTDPYMRDAREFTDYILNTIPGLGEGLSPRYDAFGDPVFQRNGLWSSDAANAVDREMQRLALETGSTPSRPSPKARGGADLRDITMTDGEFAGRNAYEVYQELGGHLPGAPSLKELAAEVIGSADYQLAPDGDAATEGTKLSILTDLMRGYRGDAMRIIEQDAAVRRVMLRKTLKVEEAYRERGAALAAGKSLPASGRPTLGEAFGVVLGDLFGGEDAPDAGR